MSQDTQIEQRPPQPRAMAALASRFNVEPGRLLQTLKDTVFKGATDSEVMALAIVANEWGLNPLTKEIYAFPAKGGGIVPVISIDGWINRVNSHPQYDGMEKDFAMESNGKPISCTVTIYRKDRNRPTKHTEFLHECHRNTEPWNKQPNRMLGHRAFIQCARLAFGFAGADPDEADLAQARVVTGREVPAETPAAGMAAMLSGGSPKQETAVTEAAPEKPRTRAPRKPAAETVTASAVQATQAEDEVLRLLDELGYQRPEFIDAVRELQITPARDLSEINAAEWAECLRQWESIRDAMNDKRPQAAGDGEEAA